MPVCAKCELDFPDIDFLVRYKGTERIDATCYTCRNKRSATYRLRKGKKPNPRPRHIPDGMQRCSRCKVIQPIDAFTKNQHQCKECRYHTCHAYYLKNTEEISERCKSYYENNKERYLALSKEWKKRNIEKVRAMVRINVKRRKALKRNAKRIERVSLDIVFARDRGICSLCHKKVKKEDASVDHIIPLSKGGDHTYQNCTLAHRKCNSSKNNRTVVQQMRLF